MGFDFIVVGTNKILVLMNSIVQNLTYLGVTPRGARKKWILKVHHPAAAQPLRFGYTRTPYTVISDYLLISNSTTVELIKLEQNLVVPPDPSFQRSNPLPFWMVSIPGSLAVGASPSMVLSEEPAFLFSR